MYVDVDVYYENNCVCHSCLSPEARWTLVFVVGKSSWPKLLGVPLSPLCISLKVCWDCRGRLSTSHGRWDLDPGPHACAASALPTEPSRQPSAKTLDKHPWANC